MNYKLKELSFHNKGFYGIGASSCDYNEEYPQYLRITDIDDFGFAPSTLPTSINPNEYPDWNKYILKENDLLFARTGNSTGRNYLYRHSTKSTVFAGFLIKFSINPDLILPRYVGYYCQSDHYWNQIRSLFTGSTRANVNAEQYGELQIHVQSKVIQQHIVNTIGSVDDLIENYQSQILSLFNYGLLLINQLNESNELTNLSAIAKLEKGIEVGSSVYLDHKTDESIKYIRVGDLLSEGSTYIPQDESKNEALEYDILIAFDGAPGRNAIGLSGSFSSGIYKIGCDNKDKGLVYFELNSKINQKIISDHSQGTTILHASKAIPHLVSVLVDSEELLKLNSIFYRLVYLKAAVRKLRSNKELLLDKYFTNQQ